MKDVAPEFSHMLSVDKTPPGGVERTLTANAAQCAQLAERFGLLELPGLTAQLTVKPEGREFLVTGHLKADVVQQCVVTLEPLPAHIEQDIDVLYAAPAPDETGDAFLVEPDDDNVEPIVNGTIDLGELVAQHLGTALDPYPRKPGAAFAEVEYGDSAPANPFAKLVKPPRDT